MYGAPGIAPRPCQEYGGSAWLRDCRSMVGSVLALPDPEELQLSWRLWVLCWNMRCDRMEFAGEGFLFRR
jgi:hypothetical protein